MRLGAEKLRSGETLEVRVITTPDPERAESIRNLLAHKGPGWDEHIRASLNGETDPLETRFYLGLIRGEAVANIMTVERFGVGILGHVFTQAEQRRKGICSALMSRLMAHFNRRGGKALLLGTGFESPPYWIYHSFGFRSLRRGFMRYSAMPYEDFERDWFSEGSTSIAPADWRHWPLVGLLASRPGSDFLRHLSWQVFGIGNIEGPYLRFMQARRENKDIDGVMLEIRNGAVLGCATIVPMPLMPQVWLVDVFTHPDYHARAADLVRALKLPRGRIVCYVDTSSPHKAEALESAGFVREATRERFLRADDTPRDVWVYEREGA